MTVIGWDVGGVNTKVARVEQGEVVEAHQEPFEIQRAPERLGALLQELAARVGASGSGLDILHALTMTAELSQMFRTKREGVEFVTNAAIRAFGEDGLHVYTTSNAFLSPAAALVEPLAVAAANWTATAHLVAQRHPNALLVDIGTTTTDIIPIVDGTVIAEGRTDPERLASGELVYTGALRTPIEAILSHIVLKGRRVGVSAEGFALIGDAYVWRGDLATDDYTAPTPDGRPPTREFAGERLARVICADREMLKERDVTLIADQAIAAQRGQITAAMRQILSRHQHIRTACVTGLGSLIAVAVARELGLQIHDIASELGDAAARYAPAAAVAILLHQQRQTA